MVVIAVLSGERFGADRTSAWVLPLLGASPWDRSAQGPNGRDDR
jgi:hypothetical protein